MATKQFIGSGKAHQQFDSVTVTLRVEELLKYTYDRESGRYVTFVVSRRQQPDNYGRTHSAFVLVQEAAPEPEAPKAKKPRKAKKA